MNEISHGVSLSSGSDRALFFHRTEASGPGDLRSQGSSGSPCKEHKRPIRSLSPTKLMSSQPMEAPGRAGQKEPFFTNKRYVQSLSYVEPIKHMGTCIPLPS